MASPSNGRRQCKAEDVLAVIKALDASERKRLLKALDGSPLLSGTNYVVLHEKVLEAVELLQDAHSAAIQMAVGFAKKVRRSRPRNGIRLERGKIILQGNRDGVSWKKTPSHVLDTHPDWFPTYRGRTLTSTQRKRFEERLRRMARDAKREEEKQPPPSTPWTK
jgi:hypothetical protein